MDIYWDSAIPVLEDILSRSGYSLLRITLTWFYASDSVTDEQMSVMFYIIHCSFASLVQRHSSCKFFPPTAPTALTAYWAVFFLRSPRYNILPAHSRMVGRDIVTAKTTSSPFTTLSPSALPWSQLWECDAGLLALVASTSMRRSRKGHNLWEGEHISCSF